MKKGGVAGKHTNFSFPDGVTGMASPYTPPSRLPGPYETTVREGVMELGMVPFRYNELERDGRILNGQPIITDQARDKLMLGHEIGPPIGFINIRRNHAT